MYRTGKCNVHRTAEFFTALGGQCKGYDREGAMWLGSDEMKAYRAGNVHRAESSRRSLRPMKGLSCTKHVRHLNLLNHHQFGFYCQCKDIASSTFSHLESTEPSSVRFPLLPMQGCCIKHVSQVTLNLSNDHHQFGFLIANAGGIICIKHVNKCHPSPVFYFADLLHHTRMNPNLHHTFARSFLPNVLIGFEKRAHQGGGVGRFRQVKLMGCVSR